MLRQPTWSQRRSVTISANNLVIHKVVETFLEVYRISLFQNVVATILQHCHNVELLAGRKLWVLCRMQQ